MKKIVDKSADKNEELQKYLELKHQFTIDFNKVKHLILAAANFRGVYGVDLFADFYFRGFFDWVLCVVCMRVLHGNLQVIHGDFQLFFLHCIVHDRWVNTNQLYCYVRLEYDLPLVQMALCTFDVCKAQRGEKLLQLLGKINIRDVNVPASFTDQLQPLDLLPNNVLIIPSKVRVARLWCIRNTTSAGSKNRCKGEAVSH